MPTFAPASVSPLGRLPFRLLPLLTVLAAPTSHAQDFAAYQVQPEVWHVAKPALPGVDARGDLSLSVPLLTVPGRGLDFEVAFAYGSGITFHQLASWIGLGWHFDPGSITRHPEGGAVRPVRLSDGTTVYQGYGVDTFERQPQKNRNTIYPTEPRDAQPDAFYLTLPGLGTVPFLQPNLASFAPNTLPAYTPGDFFPERQRAWKIGPVMSPQPIAVGSYSTSDGSPTGHDGKDGKRRVDRPDIAGFVVTTGDGSRFVFARPTLAVAEASKDLIGYNGTAHVARQIYVGTWRLVAALGPDAADPVPEAVFDPVQPLLWPTNDVPGGWVRFEYGPVRELSDPFPPEGQGYPSDFIQTVYLKAVVTPTHRALFRTADRMHARENFPDYVRNPRAADLAAARALHQRLTDVELYSRLTTPAETLIEHVRLDQRTDPNAHAWDGYDRLLLDRLSFPYTGGADPRPGYVFTYRSLPSWPTGLPPHPDNTADGCIDDFGYLDLVDCYGGVDRDETSGATWSLASIRFPSGGTVEIDYTNDAIDTSVEMAYRLDVHGSDRALCRAPQDPSNTRCLYRLADRYRRWGGARVTSITQRPGVGPDVVTRYRYPPEGGVPSGVPGGLGARLISDVQSIRAFGLDPSDDPLTRSRLMVGSSRGKSAVFYDWIETVYDDGSATLTTYATSRTRPHVVPIETVVYTNTVACAPDDLDCGDIVAIQGNQQWNWGHPVEIEHFSPEADTPSHRVEHVTRGLQLGPHATLGRAWTWTLDGREQTVDLLFGTPRLISELTRFYAEDGASYHQRFHVYDPATGLLAETRESGTDTRMRITRLTRAHTVYPDMAARNRFSPVVREDVLGAAPLGQAEAEAMTPGSALETVAEALATHAATVTTWRPFAFTSGGESVWKPHRRFAWRNEAPSALPPSFSSWDEGAQPGPEWVRAVTFETYDAHGRAVRQTDAHGVVTSFFYGDNDAPFSNAATGFRHAYLTGVQRGSLTLTQRYDGLRGLIIESEDASGVSTGYAYDPYGRLAGVRNDAGALLAAHTYTFSATGAAGALTTLNSAATSRYTGDPDVPVYQTADFFDGLGRPVAAWSLDPAHPARPYVYTTTAYDNRGRSARVARPFRAAAPDPLAVLGTTEAEVYYRSHAPALYCEDAPDNGAAFPYTLQTYEPDPRNRLRTTVPPHCATGAPPQVTQRYGIEGHAYTETVDENGRATRVYVDALGRTVQTRAGIGTAAETTTRFAYDVRGQLLEVEPPNGPAYRSLYRYDTIGQLIFKATPDHDAPFRYRYDIAGNLRFVEDPNRSGGGLLYRRYDLHNRVVETGVATNADFDTADPDDPAFPATGRSEVAVYTYDTYQGLPLLPPDVPTTNGLGRLTQVAFGGDGSPLHRYQSFYDTEGRVAALNVCLDGLPEHDGRPCALIRYAYDHQGQIVEASISGHGGRLTHTIDYDALGRPADLWTRLDGEAQPTREAAYTYTAAGQPRRLALGSGGAGPESDAVQDIDYRYTLRGWLTHINDPAGPGSGTDAFALRLGYDGITDLPGGPLPGVAPQYNGNVAWTVWRTSGNEQIGEAATDRAALAGYAYRYDPLDRLTAADFSALTGAAAPAWTPTPAFDVTLGIDGAEAYDAHGNILSLRRTGLDGSPRTLRYTYESARNRLAALDIDGTSTTFAYDANGNALSGLDGLTFARYSRLDLPRKIRADGLTTTHEYDAEGRRVVKRTVPDGGGAATETFYVRGLDGAVVAVYTVVGDGTPGVYWNILSGGTAIGRVEPAGETARDTTPDGGP